MVLDLSGRGIQSARQTDLHPQLHPWAVVGGSAVRDADMGTEKPREEKAIMSVQNLANVILILLIVGWMGLRQLKWQPVVLARMVRMPVVLFAVGLLAVSQTSGVKHVTATDVGVLVVEAVISLGIGALMGVLGRFRPLSREAAEAHAAGRHGQESAPEYESRTGWLGFALWVVFIGVRVGIDVWATHAGSTLAASTGIILVMVAVNRFARLAVFASRVGRLSQVAV